MFANFPSKGSNGGEYRETRDVIFLPSGERSEKFNGKPLLTLSRLQLTEEDFRDIREVQPFLFSADLLWMYETKLQGEEKIGDVDCWILQVRPRQLHKGVRLFDGTFWIDKRDYSVIRSEGQAVPQIISRQSENLFPRFVTERRQIDGLWFPAVTQADDTLPFRSGAIRMRMRIEYSNYQRFAASSSIEFAEEPKK